jgi:hypothetical protein
MKIIYTLAFIVALSGNIVAQQVYSCVRNISTNPNDPYNLEWQTMYPEDPGSFINTGFNWYSAVPLVIYPQIQNWALPASYQNTHYMKWPFAMGNDDIESNNNYLYRGLTEEERDFHWEDGWELLYLNLGKLPNGTFTTQIPNGSWSDQGQGANQFAPDPAKLPYFILYNRYRGTLRIFANLWMFEEDFHHIYAKLRFTKASRDNKELSGIMRHAEGIDRALDQPTEIAELIAPRRFKPIDEIRWYVIDLQLGYDPCQCKIPSTLQLEFAAIKELDVDLEQRQISIEQDITKLNETQKEWLQYSAGNPGNVIYKSIEGLLADYNTSLEKYEQDLKDYNSPVNQLKKSVVSMVGTAVSGGITSLVPTEAIRNFMIGNQLELWGNKYPADTTDAKKFAEDLKSSGKKLMADQFDFLNTLLDVKENKPTRPQVPVATLSEGRLIGTITDSITEPAGPLFVPGTMPTAYNNNPRDIAPANFPSYNNLPGLFALLRTPQLQVYDKLARVSSFDPQIFPLPEPEDYPKSTKRVSLRLLDGLHYALNPALDWDMEKTSILFGFQLEFDMGVIPEVYREILDTEVKEFGNNFELTHRLTAKDGKTEGIFTSQYYPISEASKVNFVLDMVNSMYRDDPHITPEIVFDALIAALPSLKRIKMKIILDAWFLQEGYDGDQVNTFQVFTYDIYNKKKHNSLEDAIEIVGGSIESNENWLQYNPGLLTLHGVEVKPSDAFVSAVEGNQIIVRAEQIKVIGNVKAQGNHELVLESLYGTTVKVGDLNPNITIRAKDFYGQGENTITITDQAFLQNFCSSDYKASGLTGKAQMRFEEEQRQRQLREQAAALNLNVYPNPASSFVQIAVQNQPQQITDVQLVLSDLTGRQILAEEQAANASGRYVLNLPELATGVYMLQVTAGDKTAVEKIAVQ